MRVRRSSWGAVIAAMALIGAACADDDGGQDTAASTDEGGDDGGPAADGESIPVGVLRSLSGTMAISEVSVRDAELLAIEEINAAGGVLGQQLVPIVEDGASDEATFAERAQKLISEDEVAVTFGGWTSASRKAMLPVFEGNESLLWYPVQYEGLEASPYIFYTGATTNQQIVPALDYLVEDGVESLYLLGSDYVFPRTANLIIQAYADAHGIEVLGEDYTPLGHTEYATIINRIRSAEPDAVFNTLNGDSNVAFFTQLRDAGISADQLPTMSVSVAEEEVRAIGADNVAGHLVAWNYFMTTDTGENAAFRDAYLEAYGDDRVVSDPMEAGYAAVHLWAAAVEAAGTTDVEAVKEAAAGISIEAPGGTYTINGDNQHISKVARVGVVHDDGSIEEVWNSGDPIEPDPYLEAYDWAEGLSAG
jgi:urea transport system substrate-binding protein